jgi:hypothetical protein
VSDYQAQFEKLVHGLLLYNNSYDDLYFISHFVAGLKEDIRAMIALHRPQDVDTASALALLQEEEFLRVRSRPLTIEFSKPTYKMASDRTKPIESNGSKLKGP